jgi:hypothetical protein
MRNDGTALLNVGSETAVQRSKSSASHEWFSKIHFAGLILDLLEKLLENCSPLSMSSFI